MLWEGKADDDSLSGMFCKKPDSWQSIPATCAMGHDLYVRMSIVADERKIEETS